MMIAETVPTAPRRECSWKAEVARLHGVPQLLAFLDCIMTMTARLTECSSRSSTRQASMCMP